MTDDDSNSCIYPVFSLIAWRKNVYQEPENGRQIDSDVNICKGHKSSSEQAATSERTPEILPTRSRMWEQNQTSDLRTSTRIP